MSDASTAAHSVAGRAARAEAQERAMSDASTADAQRRGPERPAPQAQERVR